MPEVPQRPGGEEAQPRLRDGAGLLASGLVHGLLLLAVVLLGSPHLFATVAPEPIIVEIVQPEELAKGKSLEAPDAKQSKPQPQQQAQPQPQPERQAAQPQPQPQKQVAQPQPRKSTR